MTFVSYVTKQKRGNTQDVTVDLAKLGSLKQQMNPQTKLFNWNIIITELEVSIHDFTLAQRMGVKTDANSKSLIVAGDKESLAKIFKAIDNQIIRLS